MKYEDLMEHKDIFFLGLAEPEVNSIRLFFGRSITSVIPEPLVIGEKELGDSYAITLDEEAPIIQVDFKSYIGYSVLNESFTVWDEYEDFKGRIFRIYNRSRYLDFISNGTIASDEHPGPFKHYGIVCVDHIVDIVSTQESVISVVKKN